MCFTCETVCGACGHHRFDPALFACERVRIQTDEEAFCAWKEMPNLSLFYNIVMPTIKYG